MCGWILNQVWIPNCWLKMTSVVFQHDAALPWTDSAYEANCSRGSSRRGELPGTTHLASSLEKFYWTAKYSYHWSAWLHKSRNRVCLHASSYSQVLKMCQLVFSAWEMPWNIVARLSCFIFHNNSIRLMLFLQQIHCVILINSSLLEWVCFCFSKIWDGGFGCKGGGWLSTHTHSEAGRGLWSPWALIAL